MDLKDIGIGLIRIRIGIIGNPFECDTKSSISISQEDSY